MRTVLITGISRGIGKALALKFSTEGDFVLGTSVDGLIDYQANNIQVLKLDLSDHLAISNCVNEIKGTGKKIDILINNAAALFDDEDIAVYVDKLRKTLEVNLIGTIDFTEKILPLMNANSHVVNISSSAGSLSNVGHSHYPNHYPSYKISKAALNMYTRTLSMRLKDSGIIVSSVHPGWVKTEMGGDGADLTPEQAAQSIYNFAIAKPETGQFWFNGEKFPW